MIKENERINSLRRTISLKKDSLGLNGDILYLKSLKKYNNLKDLKYPKSVSKYTLYGIKDTKNRFEDLSYVDVYKTNQMIFVFDKIKECVCKKIKADFIDMLNGMSTEDSIKSINRYIKENTLYTDYLVVEPKDNINLGFAIHLIEKELKTQTYMVVSLDSRFKFKTEQYTPLDVVLSKKSIGSWIGRGVYEGKHASIVDIYDIITRGILVKYVGDYLSNEDNFEKIKNKFSSVIRFNKEYQIKTISSSLVMTELIEDNGGELINPIKVLIALSMEEMLKKSFEIQQYEDRLKSLSGDYAKTYMTKKNIPKKIQSFMNNNVFLNMFGFVEADEDCELEKLDKISTEFKNLSKEIYLPIVKNHSLRFRKLGKMKALGVYYPGYDTLAVDLDGISSFIHEMFHMIDYENDILSLNSDFEPLLKYYIELLDRKVDSFGEDSDIYEFWCKGKSKYSRAYYTSNEEAFARMGELYITEVLNIQSSFSKLDYSSDIQQIVYPKDEKLLSLISEYYKNIFSLVESKFDRVLFESSEELLENNTDINGYENNNSSSEQLSIISINNQYNLDKSLKEDYYELKTEQVSFF